MGQFLPDDYETVDTRIHRFWSDHPCGRISTTAIQVDSASAFFKAEVWREDEAAVENGPPGATGFAHERAGDGPVNKTSHVENCETSAIGRALANLGYSTRGKRPSAEEMSKPDPAPTVTAEQQQAMVKAAADAGMKPEDALKVLHEVAGVDSSAKVLAADYEKVMAAFVKTPTVDDLKAATAKAEELGGEVIPEGEWD